MKSTLKCFLILLFVMLFPTLLGLAHAAEKLPAASVEVMLADLEATSGGRLGVYALNTADDSQIRYRADERFPLCSTFKVILTSAILEKSTQVADLLQQRIHYVKSDLVSYSPISEHHVDAGMTVAELCAAALQYSDNTSANLLIKLLGGPSAVTEYARSIGNTEFRLDRWETELNTAIPGDLRDTTTPQAMGVSLQSLILGDALSVAQKTQLKDWMLQNTTGAKRIRAGVPTDWQVGDKTGSGSYGTANDVAVIWPPDGKKPIVLAIYATQREADAKWSDETIASAAQIVVQAFTTQRISSPHVPKK